MQDSIYRFAGCTVDVAKRELRVDGHVRALEPLPFDLLVMLVRHRDRPVARDELLDRLWTREDASLASLASAIAKVRRAIGDSAKAPLIRTVHKLGYRFIADVAEELPGAGAAAGFCLPGGAAITVALLPTQTPGEDPTLDWVSLGLPALVGAELAEVERLLPLPISAVLAAVRPGAVADDPAQRVRAVHEFTGARCIVRTAVQRGDAGLELDYRVHLFPDAGPTALAPSNRLCASEPVQLGRLLARQLRAHLRHEDPSADVAGEQFDAWAMEVLAHALQAASTQRWQRAVHQLTVVLDIEPHHVRAQLELLQAQAHLHVAHGRYGAALDLWRQAEARAGAAGHRRFAARASSRCAQIAVLCGLWEEATGRAQDAMAFVQSVTDPSEACLRANELCMVYWLTDQPLPALPFTLGATPPATLAENARAAWWAVKGHYSAQERGHLFAATCFAEGARLYALQGVLHGRQILQLRCTQALIEAGRLAEAEATLQGIDLAGENTFPFIRRMVDVFRARIMQAQGRLEAALSLLHPIVEQRTFDYPHAYACILSARWHAQEGRLDEARMALASVEGSQFQRHIAVKDVLAAVDRAMHQAHADGPRR